MSDIRDIWLHAHRMLRTARKMVNANLRPLNLSSAEGNILLHLLTQGEDLGQEQLVAQLDVSKPAVSRALAALEAKGFLTRLPDPGDRRAQRIHLTGHARTVGPAVLQAYNHLYTLALQDISQEELAHFLQVFKRISDNFSRTEPRMPQELRDDAE